MITDINLDELWWVADISFQSGPFKYIDSDRYSSQPIPVPKRLYIIIQNDSHKQNQARTLP